MKRSFDHLAASFSVLAGLTAFAYALSFVLVTKNYPQLGATLSALFLLLEGFFVMGAFVGIYERLKEVSAGFSLESLLIGIAGALGMALHGGYDLANALHPPLADLLAAANLPSQVDPRGLLTFGFVGVALMKFSYLASKSNKVFSRGLINLGYLTGLALIALYVARLVVLNPASPWIAYLVLATGFVLGPLWYLKLGSELWVEKRKR